MRLSDPQLVTLSGSGLVDFAGACYQGVRSCQDRGHYAKTVRTIKFVGQGAPIAKGELVYPFISKIERAPTKLDPEAGLATRSSTSITMIDETCPDIDDPYRAFRAAPAAGTYWPRFLARNLNYGNRPARLVQQYVDRGVFGAAVTELFAVDSIKGPSGSGEVKITLKDPSKLLDKAKAPTPTSAKLGADLGVSDLVITLAAGDGAKLSAAGWVRIGDEAIRYSSNVADVLTLASSSYRAQFGTEAGDGKAGDVVQQCLVFVDAAFSDVVKTLYNLAGIDDAQIDIAGLQAEEATWLGSNYRITRCITDPEDVDKLIKELLQPAHCMAWWSPVEQKHKFKIYAPASPAAVVTKTLTDVESLIDRSVELERLDNLRMTLCAMYYNLANATADGKEPKNFLNADLAVDVDAESAAEYDERISKTNYSRWYGSANTIGMRAFVQREVGRHRDAPENVRKLSLDPKDADIIEGDIVDLEHQGLVDESGAPRAVRCLVTSRLDRGTHVEYSARITTFDRRYGFIAPDGTPNYPNNAGYACVSSAAGKMLDGTSGYLVI